MPFSTQKSPNPIIINGKKKGKKKRKEHWGKEANHSIPTST